MRSAGVWQRVQLLCFFPGSEIRREERQRWVGEEHEWARDLDFRLGRTDSDYDGEPLVRPSDGRSVIPRRVIEGRRASPSPLTQFQQMSNRPCFISTVPASSRPRLRTTC